jgi:hypothetical protein
MKTETFGGMKNISNYGEGIFTKNIFTMMQERSMISIIEALSESRKLLETAIYILYRLILLKRGTRVPGVNPFIR